MPSACKGALEQPQPAAPLASQGRGGGVGDVVLLAFDALHDRGVDRLHRLAADVLASGAAWRTPPPRGSPSRARWRCRRRGAIPRAGRRPCPPGAWAGTRCLPSRSAPESRSGTWGAPLVVHHPAIALLLGHRRGEVTRIHLQGNARRPAHRERGAHQRLVGDAEVEGDAGKAGLEARLRAAVVERYSTSTKSPTSTDGRLTASLSEITSGSRMRPSFFTVCSLRTMAPPGRRCSASAGIPR